MPTYEYRCQSCGSVFEIRQKFVDAPLTVHEGCGGEVQRLISAPALSFKGSGWYVTDYAKSNGPAKDKGGDQSKNGGDSKGEKKTDSKSESKSESKAESKSESKSLSSSSDSKSSGSSSSSDSK